MTLTSPTVAVVGLGYVGLPLVVEFGRHLRTIGFDSATAKVAACREGRDPSREIPDADMAQAVHAEYTSDPHALREADFILVAVPTPVDVARNPDFGPLIGASRAIAQHLKPGAIVIYESTVYPGATEEVCIPVLERESGKRWKRDFFVGYSPERINPGDREHQLTNVVKVVSGDTPATLDKVAALYERIVAPGVHRCSSIKAAEACKVIENTQRDLNIALMNELAIIFDKIGIDTTEVLEAAGTKWNFLKFSPGLVGGHCIGVDPYYLTHKAETLGYHPQVKLAAPYADHFSYTLSKYALSGASELAARALAPRVRVNAVASGYVLPSPGQSEEDFRRLHPQTPLGRGTTPQDVATAVLFLLENEAVTGQTIYLDSGLRFAPADRDFMFR